MNKIHSGMTTFWQRISTAAVRLPGLSPAEQTRASWAKLIASYSDLPPAYGEFFASRQEKGLALPYTLLLPAFEGFFQRSPEMLVSDLGDATAVLEKSGASCQKTIFPHAGLISLEWRVVLLDGRLKISGPDQDGVFNSVSLRFNAVTDYLLFPLVERMRRAAAGIPASNGGAQAELFAQWSSTSYKFMNYARRSLLSGEQAVQTILQTEIRRPAFSFLGRTLYQTLAPTQALILTGHELILIREEALRRARVRYGGVWDYLPLRRIEGVKLEEQEGELLELTVELDGDQRVDFRIDVTRRREVDALLKKIREGTAR